MDPFITGSLIQAGGSLLSGIGEGMFGSWQKRLAEEQWGRQKMWEDRVFAESEIPAISDQDMSGMLTRFSRTGVGAANRMARSVSESTGLDSGDAFAQIMKSRFEQFNEQSPLLMFKQFLANANKKTQLLGSLA